MISPDKVGQEQYQLTSRNKSQTHQRCGSLHTVVERRDSCPLGYYENGA